MGGKWLENKWYHDCGVCHNKRLFKLILSRYPPFDAKSQAPETSCFSKSILNGVSFTLADSFSDRGWSREYALNWHWDAQQIVPAWYSRPDIPGLSNFKGNKVHTAGWNPKIQLENGEIALIGAGSTSIQLLPEIQPLANRIHHYIKGQNWTSSVGIGGGELIRRDAPVWELYSHLLLYVRYATHTWKCELGLTNRSLCWSLTA